MPLPSFNESGDLPAGVHPATLGDVTHRLGQRNARRAVVARRLERVYRLAAQTGHLARFVVFGSFVTDKAEPNDVDVFMVMDDDFDVEQVEGEARLLFEHTAAQDHFGCSAFWLRRLAALGGEQAAVEQWQVKRDGTRRGIVEITSE